MTVPALSSRTRCRGSLLAVHGAIVFGSGAAFVAGYHAVQATVDLVHVWPDLLAGNSGAEGWSAIFGLAGLIFFAVLILLFFFAAAAVSFAVAALAARGTREACRAGSMLAGVAVVMGGILVFCQTSDDGPFYYVTDGLLIVASLLAAVLLLLGSPRKECPSQ